MPTQLCGIDILFAEWVAIAAYLALGSFIIFQAARHEEKPLPSYHWGDSPRRPGKSFEVRVLEHIGGVAVFLSICVYGLHGLGIG